MIIMTIHFSYCLGTNALSILSALIRRSDSRWSTIDTLVLNQSISSRTLSFPLPCFVRIVLVTFNCNHHLLSFSLSLPSAAQQTMESQKTFNALIQSSGDTFTFKWSEWKLHCLFAKCLCSPPKVILTFSFFLKVDKISLNVGRTYPDSHFWFKL
jgi:hypothetical protein